VTNTFGIGAKQSRRQLSKERPTFHFFVRSFAQPYGTSRTELGDNVIGYALRAQTEQDKRYFHIR
jgi:hypothetical protein